MSRRRVSRWQVGLIGTLALTGLGLVYADPTLLTAAAIPLAYVLYEAISTVPEDVSFRVSRSFDPPVPAPGEHVEVTLTLENTGDNALTDVRIIDGIPDELSVTSGAPRTAAPLAPDEQVTLRYSIVGRRGEFEFDDPVVRVRSLSGSEQVTVEVPAEEESVLTCAHPVRRPPVNDASVPLAGLLPTDSGGSGLEFYSTRQYRAGDPMKRIDWRHFAKTGEFVTVQYREEQAARTVLVLDARPVGRVTPAPGYPTGVSLCAYAGERIHDALDRAGVVTSVTAVGFEEGDLDGLVGPDGLPWVDSGVKTSQQLHPSVVFQGVQDIAEEDAVPVSTRPPSLFMRDAEAGSTGTQHPSPPPAHGDGTEKRSVAPRTDGNGVGPIIDLESEQYDTETIERLLARIPPNAQVVVCTAALDNWPVALVQAFSARGYSLLVLSPDVLSGETPGQRVARVYREMRLQSIERMATTVTWDPEEPVDYALSLSLPNLLGQP